MAKGIHAHRALICIKSIFKNRNDKLHLKIFTVVLLLLIKLLRLLTKTLGFLAGHKVDGSIQVSLF